MIVKIKDIKPNPDNPRTIKEEKFNKLKKSIQEFPEMLNLRPIVVDDDMVVLGGNMRLKALIDLGVKETEVIKASDLTEEQKAEFVIKDNVGFGEWDWDILANEWSNQQITDWGLDVWNDQDALFDVDDTENENNSPTGSDDGYSTFEMIMLHENKIQLLDTLNKIKSQYMFEKQEDALMELIRQYNK